MYSTVQKSLATIQGCNDNPYLFLGVFIRIQPENTGNMYTI